MNLQDIRKRIGERTGLTTEDEISAYMHFCRHADLMDGVILFGDVQYEFYREIFDSSDELTQRREKKFYEDVFNNSRSSEEERRNINGSLAIEAEEKSKKYLELFISKGLVQKPRKVRMSQDKYPVLSDYNYFNDSEIYLASSTPTSEGRTLRI